VFRYRAKNTFGWGPYSDLTTLQGIDEPNQMNSPVTSNIDDYVLVNWDEATSNGSPILEYKLEI